MTSIADEAAAAVRSRNGRGRQPSARSRIEAAQHAAASAVAAAEAAAAGMRELYANPLIARLDTEGLGSELQDEDLAAILTLVRSLESRNPLPHRVPGGNGTGPQAAQRMMP